MCCLFVLFSLATFPNFILPFTPSPPQIAFLDSALFAPSPSPTKNTILVTSLQVAILIEMFLNVGGRLVWSYLAYDLPGSSH